MKYTTILITLLSIYGIHALPDGYGSHDGYEGEEPYECETEEPVTPEPYECETEEPDTPEPYECETEETSVTPEIPVTPVTPGPTTGPVTEPTGQTITHEHNSNYATGHGVSNINQNIMKQHVGGTVNGNTVGIEDSYDYLYGQNIGGGHHGHGKY